MYQLQSNQIMIWKTNKLKIKYYSVYLLSIAYLQHFQRHLK